MAINIFPNKFQAWSKNWHNPWPTSNKQFANIHPNCYGSWEFKILDVGNFILVGPSTWLTNFTESIDIANVLTKRPMISALQFHLGGLKYKIWKHVSSTEDLVYRSTPFALLFNIVLWHSSMAALLWSRVEKLSVMSCGWHGYANKNWVWQALGLWINRWYCVNTQGVGGKPCPETYTEAVWSECPVAAGWAVPTR